MTELWATLFPAAACCTLPDGQVVNVDRRRVPLYDLARVLDGMGFGDWTLQAYTPTGTPSLRGGVSVMAKLTVVETDRDGLVRRKFVPFDPTRLAKDARKGRKGTPTPAERAVALYAATVPD